jgi:glycine cleavage system H protein
LSINDAFGVVESIKSVSDLLAPLSGEVVERNDQLDDAPELCNESPYENAWMVKIKLSNPDEKNNLLSPADYLSHCENEH